MFDFTDLSNISFNDDDLTIVPNLGGDTYFIDIVNNIPFKYF